MCTRSVLNSRGPNYIRRLLHTAPSGNRKENTRANRLLSPRTRSFAAAPQLHACQDPTRRRVFKALLDSVRFDIPVGQPLRHNREFSVQWDRENWERQRQHERRMHEIGPQLSHHSSAIASVETNYNALWKLSEAVANFMKSLPAARGDPATLSIAKVVSRSIERPYKVREQPLRRSPRLQEQKKQKKSKAPKPARGTKKPTAKTRRRT